MKEFPAVDRSCRAVRTVSTQIVSVLALGPAGCDQTVTHNGCEGVDRKVLVAIKGEDRRAVRGITDNGEGHYRHDGSKLARRSPSPMGAHLFTGCTNGAHREDSPLPIRKHPCRIIPLVIGGALRPGQAPNEESSTRRVGLMCSKGLGLRASIHSDSGQAESS
jgi:hypothetical protein